MEQALKKLMRIWLLMGANQYPKKLIKKVLTNRMVNDIMIIVNESEVMIMKTVLISYETISPTVLAYKIERAFACMTKYREVDKDTYELSVFGCTDLAMLEDLLAEYV